MHVTINSLILTKQFVRWERNINEKWNKTNARNEMNNTYAIAKETTKKEIKHTNKLVIELY